MNKRLPSRNGESAREFLFHETALDGKSFARDFVPAFLIMIAALGLSVWLPVQADSGLRPVESSLLVIVGSLAACAWIVIRRLRRLKRRVLAISSEAVRVYPPRGLLALPGHPEAADLEIPHESVAEVVSSRLDSIAGKVLRSKAGMTLSRYEIRTDDEVHVFDDLRWCPDIDTMSRLEREAASGDSEKRLSRSLDAALRLAGYPVRRQ